MRSPVTYRLPGDSMTKSTWTTSERPTTVAMTIITVAIAMAHHHRRNQLRFGGSSSGGDEAPCTIVSRLFTFVIGLVVVVTVVAIAARPAKPATRRQDGGISRGGRDRGRVLPVPK